MCQAVSFLYCPQATFVVNVKVNILVSTYSLTSWKELSLTDTYTYVLNPPVSVARTTYISKLPHRSVNLQLDHDFIVFDHCPPCTTLLALAGLAGSILPAGRARPRDIRYQLHMHILRARMLSR